ncbi:MAG TPA: sulfotransferase [Casimicrobiaceae bacterium]|nr:sulfotransferase [Casimicrobiaceae bacterium]
MLSPQHRALRHAAGIVAEHYSPAALLELFRQPLIVLSAPRSGSTLLFETLRCSDALWSIGTESHFIFNAFPQLHPAERSFDSGALAGADATPALCHQMRACFLAMAQDTRGRRYLDLPESERPRHVRLLEKTPRNALNIPFLQKLFPDLLGLFLHREPREAIASIMEAWKTGMRQGGFVTFPDLPGWDLRHWCLLLPPGWRALNGRSLAEIAAFQWRAANETILRDLRQLGRERWLPLRYCDLLDDTTATIRRIVEFAGLPFDGPLKERASAPLPLSRSTVSAPERDKWRRHAEVIEALAAQYAPLARELASLR